MGRGDSLPLRALPRVFLDTVEVEPVEIGDLLELPGEEIDKLRKVLRLSAGAQIAILPGDGRLLRCTFTGREGEVSAIERLETESPRQVTLAQALPKGDKLDEVVRMGTEIGVAAFQIFPSERSVVRWDETKLRDRARRLNAIAREAAEVSYRAVLPRIEYLASLSAVLERDPSCVVLSEAEGVPTMLAHNLPEGDLTLVIGPEGGWTRREIALIGDRAFTLGPRVLRVDTAATAAAAIALLR